MAAAQRSVSLEGFQLNGFQGLPSLLAEHVSAACEYTGLASCVSLKAGTVIANYIDSSVRRPIVVGFESSRAVTVARHGGEIMHAYLIFWYEY